MQRTFASRLAALERLEGLEAQRRLAVAGPLTDVDLATIGDQLALGNLRVVGDQVVRRWATSSAAYTARLDGALVRFSAYTQAVPPERWSDRVLDTYIVLLHAAHPELARMSDAELEAFLAE